MQQGNKKAPVWGLCRGGGGYLKYLLYKNLEAER